MSVWDEYDLQVGYQQRVSVVTVYSIGSNGVIGSVSYIVAFVIGSIANSSSCCKAWILRGDQEEDGRCRKESLYRQAIVSTYV